MNTWTRQWIRKSDNICVEIIVDSDGDSGVEYIYDRNSVFPRWKKIYYETAYDTYCAMEQYHEDPEFEEV